MAVYKAPLYFLRLIVPQGGGWVQDPRTEPCSRPEATRLLLSCLSSTRTFECLHSSSDSQENRPKRDIRVCFWYC